MPSSAAAGPAPRPRRRDPRPWIYAAIDALLAVVLVVVITEVAPNRHAWAQALLWLLPGASAAMAAGTLAGAVLPGARARRIAWAVAVVGGAVMLVVTVVLLVLLLMAASFLSGVYGGIGKGAATGALAAAALIVEVCGLLPALQLKYLLTRAGRRALGLPPLWGAGSGR
jgi:hypothetical protein